MILDFFEMLKYYFCNLEFMVIRESDVDYFWGSDEEVCDEGIVLCKIYCCYGWLFVFLGG